MTTTTTAIDEIAALAEQVGIRHLHVVAWRDLSDVEAGGSELYVSRLAERWAAAGLDVFLRTSYAQGHRPRGARDGYHMLRRAGRNMVFPATVLEEVLRSNGPIDALVEVWNGVPYFSPVWFRGPKVVILHHVHRDMWNMVLESEKLAALGARLETQVAPVFYRRSEIVTNSDSTRDDLVETMGFARERVSVVPPGIDPRFTAKGEKSPTPLVVAAGRLMPTKRFDDLIRAAVELKPAHPDLEVVIAGDGYDRGNLLQLIADVGAEGWIHLPGRITDEELVELYQRAWVLAATSVAEGWGMTITEAAACGTPAVATRIPGHADAILDDRSGLLADSQADLVAKLDAVLADADLRDRLTQGALERAEEFTWDAAARSIFRVLARDAERRRKR